MTQRGPVPQERRRPLARSVVRSCEIDPLSRLVDRFPSFVPHALLRSGHAQTLAANLFYARRYRSATVRRTVALADGDVVFLHDDRPASWRRGAPVALLIHGLAGCHRSPYMVRVAGRLNEAGVRTFRMDMRACGAGEGLARMPYHGGCSGDLLAAARRIAHLCPASPLRIVGFSIGGNVALKMLGERAGALPPQLDRAIALNPAIDLPACVERLSRARFYDRRFVKTVYRQLLRNGPLLERAPHVLDAPRPRGIREFDTLYTSLAWGFETAEDFYNETSSLPVIDRIRVRTLVMTTRDDPVIPFSIFERLSPPRSVTLHVSERGGHLGYIGRAGADPDRRWMDWRIVDWITADERTGATSDSPALAAAA